MRGSMVWPVLVVVACALGPGCATDGPADEPPATETLPLQQVAFKPGGDAEADAPDLLEASLTESQLEEVAEACGDVADIPVGGDDDCRRVVQQMLLDGGPRCGAGPGICMTLRELDDGYAGFVEVTDSRVGSSRCEAGPGNACLRLGVESRRAVETLAGEGPTPTETGDPTPTETGDPTPTETGDPTPTDTGDPTPTETGDPTPTDADPTPSEGDPGP